MTVSAARFAALYMLGVIANMCASFQAPLVGPLSKSIGVSPNQIGFAMSAQFIAYLLGGSAAGRIVARAGVRRAAQGGLIVIALTLLFNWHATSLIHLLLGNLVQGFGMLMVVVAAQIGVTVVTAEEERARVLASWATAPLVGLALGLLLSSAFADGAAWRIAFPALASIAAVLLGICFLLPLAPLITDTPETKGRGLTGEIDAVRLCIAVAFSVIAINGSVSSWPLYLAAVHGMTTGTIGGLSSLAMLTGIAGSLAIGFALGRQWPARRLVGIIAPLAMVSAILVFGAFAGFPTAVLAMFTWNLAAGAMTALIFAILPGVVRNPGNLPAATGLLYQFAAVGTILGAPLYLWLAEGRHAAVTLTLVTCGVVLAASLVFPFGRRADKDAGPLAAEA